MYVYTSINLRNNITFYYKFSAYSSDSQGISYPKCNSSSSREKISRRFEENLKESRGRASAVFRYTLRARCGATRRDTTRFLSTVTFMVDRIVVVDKQIYHSYILVYKRNLYRVQTLLFRVDFIQRKMSFVFLSSSRLRPEIRGNIRNY